MTTTTELSELTGDYVLDTAHTRIGFLTRAMASRVRGQFDEFEGSAHLDGNDPSTSSAVLTVQTGSIQTRNEKRDDHLRDRFLDVPNHSTITFASTRTEQVGETNFRVTGDLTIRAVTRPVTVDFRLTGVRKDRRGRVRIGFEGSATINRKDWGVNWNAATGALLSDRVTLEFDVAAIRRS